MMLIFPTLQPEELLYSACARYSRIFRYPGDRAVAEELFGTRQATSIIGCPVGLEHLIERLPTGHPYTSAGLIAGHTTLPYFAHWMDGSRHHRILQLMHQGRHPGGVTALLGTGRGSIPGPPSLLYCAACAAEDRARIGEACWRRAHQLPGVFVCPSHGVPLNTGPVRVKDLKAVFRYHVLDDVIADADHSSPPPQPAAPPERLQWIAGATQTLLRLESRPITTEALKVRHRAWMTSAGFVTRRGFEQKAAERALVSHWGDDLLTAVALHPADRSRRTTSWMRARVRAQPKPASGHPLMHLLLIGLYGISVENFLDGPFPEFTPSSRNLSAECANPACRLYRPALERSTARLAYLRTGKAHCCGVCQAEYEEFSPRKNVRFLKTGSAWDDALRRRIVAGASLLQLAQWALLSRELVLCHSSRLGCWRAEWGDPDEFSLEAYRSREAATVQAKRAEWQRAMLAMPSATRKAVAAQAPAAWAYLRNHDMAWLMANSPPAVPRGTRARPNTSIDWPARDRDLLARCGAAVARLLDSSPPVRLALASIGRCAGARSMINKEPHRLPLTRAYIDSVKETVHAFTKRRIRWHAEQHILNQKLPVYSDFLETCGIEWAHRHDYNEELRTALMQIREALAPGGAFAEG